MGIGKVLREEVTEFAQIIRYGAIIINLELEIYMGTMGICHSAFQILC